MKKEKLHYYRQNLPEDKEIRRGAYLILKHCTKLYNEALFLHNLDYRRGLGFSSFVDIKKRVSPHHSELLGDSVVTSVVRNCDINLKNYFNNLKKSRNLNPPSFRNVRGEHFVAFFNCSINRNGTMTIYMPRGLKEKYKVESLNIKISENFIKKNKPIKQVRLYKDYIVLHYMEEVEEIQGGFSAGIDLGVDNLISVFSNNPNSDPFVISGKNLKFINYKTFKNKNICYKKRRQRILAYFDRCVAYLFKYCKKYGITTLYVGYFKSIKDKKVSRNFYYIPYVALRRKIRDMGQKFGVIVILQEESYTSKTCFWLDENIGKNEDNFGYRAERGLFKVKAGDQRIVYNCDINGAANILRKKVFIQCTRVRQNVLKNPKKLRIKPQKNKNTKKI